MKSTNRRTLKTILRWILWVFLVQFILINTSAIFYAYKLTHFYEASPGGPPPVSNNVFKKTWRLFSGPRFEKAPIKTHPVFLYETVRLITKNNIPLEAWYMPADSSKGTIIMFHGLGLNKSMQMDQAYELHYMGFNIMLVDLRAHGGSGGNTTTLGINESEDVKLAYDYVVNRGDKNIILYGMSLGAVAVVKSIYDYNISPSKIILDAPFLNLKRHLEARARGLGFPEEPFGTLITFWINTTRGLKGFKHNTNKYVAKVNCPVLMQYGAKDRWVLNDETQSIFAHIASKNKKLVVYENSGHEFYLRTELAKWREEMKSFLL